MYGLTFEDQPPIQESSPFRADVACFIGTIRRRTQVAVPEAMRQWLFERGWLHAVDAGADSELLDVPVPLESWEQFDLLFAWEEREIDPDTTGSTYLGAAVRSFFAQGGRRCYLVRVGDPPPYVPAETELREERMATQLEALLPGSGSGMLTPTAADQSTWRGIGHLFGLPDVSFLCLPDLPDIVKADVEPVAVPEETWTDEQFVECSTDGGVTDQAAPAISAPRCDETGYQRWSEAVKLAGQFLARSRREVQLVAAVPLPETGGTREFNLLSTLIADGSGPLAVDLDGNGTASAFVQLVYPWVRTPGSDGLPEQLETPDGVLSGLLARTALTAGAFRSAGNARLGDVYDVWPVLDRNDLLGPVTDPITDRRYRLLERVSLFGPTPDGLRLLSDVTASLDESYRQAHVNRLVSTLVRSARRLGEEILFEPSGERLWASVRERISRLLLGMLQAGALRGRSPEEAFQVRCDRSTMNQNDIDNGRVVAEIVFDPAAAIEQITVVLAMEKGGSVSLQ